MRGGMARTRCLLTIIILTISYKIYGILSVDFEQFGREDNFGGNICATGNVIENISYISDMHCMFLCSKRALCHGVFIEHNTKRCVICSGQIFTQSSENGTTFFKRQENPPVSTYLLITNPLLWYEAKTNCENLGGHLLILSSSEENDVIVEYLSPLADVNKILIGANGTGGQAETFRWIDGTAVSGGFQNWYGSQPHPALTEERFVLMITEWGYQWNDDVGYTHSICEFE